MRGGGSFFNHLSQRLSHHNMRGGSDDYLNKPQLDENKVGDTSNQMGSTKRFRCKNGYNQRPPKSKKCKTIRRKKCKNGWRRNPQTKRCRKRKTSKVATENLLETISPSYQNLTMNERLRV